MILQKRYLPKETLQKDLTKACKEFGSSSVLIHTDLLKIGITASPQERLQICRDYQETIHDALNDNTILIPTFNYQFCKDRMFDRKHSPSQVGAFSDFCREQDYHLRTRTPVFNFVIYQNNSFSFKPSHNVFGKESIFAELHRQDGFILFLGAEFAANTFIHYIEECHQVGYRYIKDFSGTLIDDNESTPITISYRVRPFMPSSIAYDWTKLTADAIKQSVLKSYPVGHGELLYYQTSHLFNLWSAKIKSDELYLLTRESQEVIRSLYNSKGYPLKIEMFE